MGPRLTGSLVANLDQAPEAQIKEAARRGTQKTLVSLLETSDSEDFDTGVEDAVKNHKFSIRPEVDGVAASLRKTILQEANERLKEEERKSQGPDRATITMGNVRSERSATIPPEIADRDRGSRVAMADLTSDRDRSFEETGERDRISYASTVF
jgi:hypothetical protein